MIKTSTLVLLFFSLIEIAGAQMPTVGGFAAAPDSWLLSKGPTWFYRTSASLEPASLTFRNPTEKEQPIIDQAIHLFQRSSAKSMALINGNEVVWVGYKGGSDEKSTFMSYSVAKTVTSMAVGKAICAQKFSLGSLTQDLVPELKGTDLGKATVRQLLMMSSGTWEGNSDSTVTTKNQNADINAGRISLLDVLKTPLVNSAHIGPLSVSRKPGEYFAYRSTDPFTIGVIINKTTGMSYARWLENNVLLPAGIEGTAIIGQDRFNFGRASGDIALTMNDWVRLAVWVKRNEMSSGCFGDYVRQASRTQIENKSKKTGQSFDGYGYFIWTDNLRLRDSYWAIGHGGQRIGWNHKNQKIIIAFSNVENYMIDLYNLYRDWATLGD